MRFDHPHLNQQPPTMAEDDSYAALSGIISNLGKQYTPADNDFNSRVAANSIESNRTPLPGPDSDAKQRLEREVAALASRVQYLENRVASSASTVYPITPNEPLQSAFSPEGSPTATRVVSSRPRSASLVNSLLAKSESPKGTAVPRQLTEEELGVLRDHVDRQSEQIKAQKEYIDSINDTLQQQRQATEQALGGIESSMDDVETLKRELSKNQQINATYQKVLREIGSIVTAVANGDLSKKVLISAKERDPEIATFKRTINKMVDQLQDFASQVTHLAREVGTEGRLGGQAVLPGVSGIWAELTQNGMQHILDRLLVHRLTVYSKHHGRQFDQPSTRNRRRNYRSRPGRSQP
jgi:osomolarity two-component system sensor histidine kinase NIK1